MTEIDIPLDNFVTFGVKSWYIHPLTNLKALIIFSLSSGSGRNSPRNKYVAKVLNENGFATLLLGRLTEEA